MAYEFSHEHGKWNRKHNCLSVSENNLLEITLILMVREDSYYRMLAKDVEKYQKHLTPVRVITCHPQEGEGAGDSLVTPYVLILLGQRHLFRYEVDQDLAVEDSPIALGLGFLLWGLKTLDWALWSSTTCSVFIEAWERKV